MEPIQEQAGEWIEERASRWNTPGVVEFTFGRNRDRSYANCMDGPADVRIEIRDSDDPSFRSLIGRLGAQAGKPTMWLPFIDSLTSDPSSSGIDLELLVLHEFGHALGLLHEEQNENAGCWKQIDWCNAIKKLGQDYGWSPMEVFENLRPPVAAEQAESSASYDGLSVMQQWLPPEVWLGGQRPPDCRAAFGKSYKVAKPSDGDLAAVRKHYSASLSTLRVNLAKLERLRNNELLPGVVRQEFETLALLIKTDVLNLETE